MKLIDILNARYALQKMLKDDMNPSLTEKIYFILNETNDFENIYNNIENKKLRDNAEFDADGNFIIDTVNGMPMYRLKKDSGKIFREEMTKLLSSEIKYHIDEDMFFSDNDLLDIQDSDLLRALALFRK